MGNKNHSTAPNVLLINPWIYDFAAYDFWAKPLGLLLLGGILRKHCINVDYIDCLNRFHPNSSPSHPHARYGRGPYLKTPIEKPEGLENIPRNYSRYGIKSEWFKKDLFSISQPDLILVTSLMTYWYKGIQETIKTIKEVFPNTPVILGGIYASLFHGHASIHSGADKVVQGEGTDKILELVEEFTGFSTNRQFDSLDLNTYPYPAFDLQTKINYIPLLTSIGCPYSCAYCASSFLNPVQMVRHPNHVVKEIIHWHLNHGVKDFVFYDDALLLHENNHAASIFKQIISEKIHVRFHTPNAVHVRGITPGISRLMFKAGFKTIRLGLETVTGTNSRHFNDKAPVEAFQKAIKHLRNSGFKAQQIGAYLLSGLPNQAMESLFESIKAVKQCGATPILAHYTPIPHTAMWKEAVISSRYDLESDPIFTNNSIYPCQKNDFSWQDVSRLKTFINDINRS